MKSLQFFLILSILLIVSCKSNVKFGLSQKYCLEEGESEIILDNASVEKYKRIINIDTLNVPLHRLIKSENYKIYIGVSFSADAENLNLFFKNDTLFDFMESHNISDSISSLYKIGKEFYYSFIYNSPNDRLTYILTIEADSSTVLNCYKNNFLQNKISSGNPV